MAKALKAKSLGQHKNQSAQTVTTNMFSNSSDLLINDDIKTAKDKKMLSQELIDLDLIIKRKKNRFELSNIESLAQSIDRVRLAQPILLRNLQQTFNIVEDGEVTSAQTRKSFEIVSGHRRYAAYQFLYNKYKAAGDMLNMEKYSKIPALILPVGATQAEIDELYESTNLESRQLKTSDLLRHISYFLNEIEAKDIEEKLINPKFRGTNKAKYIQSKFSNLNVEISPTQIKRYISVYEKGTKDLINIFENGTISLNTCYKISTKFNKADALLEQKQNEFAEKIRQIDSNESLSDFQKETEKNTLTLDFMMDIDNDTTTSINAIRKQEKQIKLDEKKQTDVETLCSMLSSCYKKISVAATSSSIYHMEKVTVEDGLTTMQKKNATFLTEEETERIQKLCDDISSSIDALNAWVQQFQPDDKQS